MSAINPVMQWEMYAPGTAVAFSAIADESGIRIVLERDKAPVLTGAAADTAMLFRMSKDLRDQLGLAGYMAKPLAEDAALMGGGPCWGPASPLCSSLIDSLR